MNEQIRKVLNKAGYNQLATTKDNLIDCFLDYIDSGFFGNLDCNEALEDIKSGDITIENILYSMNKYLK